MISLGTLRDSLEGAVPSAIATCDAAGVPNISYLSHVHYIDEEHVGLSNQFFSKTAANVQSSGRATVMVVNGRTGQQHILELNYLRSEKSGPLYDRLKAQLEISPAAEGMQEVMRLRGVDVYRVVSITAIIATDPLIEALPPENSIDRLSAVNRVAADMARAVDIEAMLDLCVDGLVDRLGYRNVIVVVPDETDAQLVTIASRGYATFGFAAETRFGEGTIGMAAKARVPIRVSDLGRTKRYMAAVSSEVQSETPSIPFPGLSAPRSQLAVPIEANGTLFGVLFIESVEPFAFTYADEEALGIIATQLGLGFLIARAAARDNRAAQRPAPADPMAANLPRITLRFDATDGTVLVNGDYLIRGVPGRLLHFMIGQYLETGRLDFSNRELRQARSLQLPDFKDNLETRLILLRRRLDEKGSPIRLVRSERGRIKLELSGAPHLA